MFPFKRVLFSFVTSIFCRSFVYYNSSLSIISFSFENAQTMSSTLLKVVGLSCKVYCWLYSPFSRWTFLLSPCLCKLRCKLAYIAFLQFTQFFSFSLKKEESSIKFLKKSSLLSKIFMFFLCRFWLCISYYFSC